MSAPSWSEVEIRQEVSSVGTITYVRTPGDTEWLAKTADWEQGSSTSFVGETFEAVQKAARGWFGYDA